MTTRRYDGSTVLVTGASRGLGEALARAFAARGASLILTARSAGQLHSVARDLRSGGTRVVVHPADLTEPDAARALVELLSARQVEVDHLVNNAGIATLGTFADQPVAEALDTVALNVRAPLELARLLLPGMVRRRRGGVLSIASTAAFYPMPSLAVYAATKAFVLSWSQAISGELQGTGVRAVAVCPGPVDTALFGAPLGESAMGVATAAPARVAEFAVEAYSRAESVAVPGLRNRLAAGLSRIVPRSLAIASADRFVKRLESNLQNGADARE